MDPLPISRYFVTALAALLASAPALADVVFTSEPPTIATVDRPYSYKMTVTISDKDGERDNDRHLRFIARALPAWLTFDGNDTIFGTPREEDIGVHSVKLRAKVKGDQVDQDFSITVEPVPSEPPPEVADLAASISVIPRSASVGDQIDWVVAARNLADVDVANIVVDTSFSGDAAFSIDRVDDSACSIEFLGSHTAVVCRWSPLPSGASRSTQVSGQATGFGEISAVASVSIVDMVPTDANPANDNSAVVVIVSDDAPVLTLNGLSVITLTYGDLYEDPGATAIDGADGDLTGEIVVDNPVDTRLIGRYSVTYDVADSDGNVATVTRTVEVVPRIEGGGGGGTAGIEMLLVLSMCIVARSSPQSLYSLN